ncbi:hypothetical protein B0H21DRAFT_250709 [Amylocystis lapponica]|nr:hypothetical protein B0H21DRAFT_250709 [Amylocystis lapponica]
MICLSVSVITNSHLLAAALGLLLATMSGHAEEQVRARRLGILGSSILNEALLGDRPSVMLTCSVYLNRCSAVLGIRPQQPVFGEEPRPNPISHHKLLL